MERVVHLLGDEVPVIEKLDFLVRFWELKARHATLGQPLGAKEQVELLSLMQLVIGECHMPEAGPVSRSASSLPAQLIGDGVIRRVEIRGITAAAIVVASGTPVAQGSQAIVRATDAVSGVEYALPCRVVWVVPGSSQDACTIALAVDGIPTRNAFALAEEPPMAESIPTGPPIQQESATRE